MSRARVDEHLLALLRLADVERRGGEIDDELRPREREVGRGRAGLPDVLADREADGRLAEPEEDEVATLGEVAVLVEHAVVREELLAVDRLHAPSAHTAHAFARSRSNHGVPTSATMPSVCARDLLDATRAPRGRTPGRRSRSSGG